MSFRWSAIDQGIRSLRTAGFRSTLKSTALFAGQRLGLEPDLIQHRYLLGQRLSSLFDHTIRYGPFRGTRLAPDSRWSAADRGSMLLGLYEQEVLAVLDRASRDREVLIDVGAADGYYVVGALSSELFDRAVCFEMDPYGRDIIGLQAEANGVSGRLSILGEASADFLSEARAANPFNNSEAVMLIDIEGAEFELLSEHVIEDMDGLILIIEVHDFDDRSSGDVSALIARLETRFSTEVVTQSERNPNSFEELREWSDDDRWLLCSESRQKRMTWIVCEPPSLR